MLDSLWNRRAKIDFLHYNTFIRFYLKSSQNVKGHIQGKEIELILFRFRFLGRRRIIYCWTNCFHLSTGNFKRNSHLNLRV